MNNKCWISKNKIYAKLGLISTYFYVSLYAMIFFLNLIFILKTSPLFIILNSYFLSFSGILLGPIIL